jgi:DNA repair exonuclease SbcCD nuclease subunit
MKVALITDTHFGVRGDNPHFYDYFQRSFDGFFEVLDMEQIEHVIHLGDLFDRRKFVNFITASKCRQQFLQPLHERGIETHIIAGNHDVYFKNTSEVNALHELVEGRYPNIHIYTEPTEIELAGTAILLLPWINDTNEKQTLDTIRGTKASIVMAHLELRDFQMSRGVIQDDGMDPAIFNRFDSVFTGHYHHKSSHNNIHYLGAFCEFTWVDYGDARGFHIFDTDTRKTNFYQNPHHIFNSVTYDDVDDPYIMESIEALDMKQFTNTFVKVVVVNKTKPFPFEVLLDKLYKEQTIDISIEDGGAISILEDEELSANTATETTQTLIHKYIDTLEIKLDTDRLKKLMSDVYKESMTLEDMD